MEELKIASLVSSRVVDVSPKSITFAILIPITSRGALETTCIDNLTTFARSLQTTTWRDPNDLGSVHYHSRIYFAIDSDDGYLLPPFPGADGRAESVLRAHGFSDITTLYCTQPPGHVCALWRDSARRAFADSCDYYVLMGDDIELLDEGWMRAIDSKFSEMAASAGGPVGFGCVAFTDMSFPGMPTFPVVHRTHLEIFGGEVIPAAFVNQDGDPYLFQLYRHFGASTTVTSRLRNSIGGSDDARYEKCSLIGWTFETLELGKDTVAEWTRHHAPSIKAMLTLDVIVPSYRVDLKCLARILNLKSSPTCSTMFIIIVDNPDSPFVYELDREYSHRMDVRIRVNKSNQGASASRNRGLSESSAEWVAFLDDDVEPYPEYLVEAERSIRAHPDAAGFVGNTYFPVAPNIFTTAVHLSGVTYFWDIAEKMQEDIPWGVTANLIARRNIRDDIEFDTRFPMTGGGEDIHYCRQKRQASINRGGSGFWAAPKAKVVHPWWNDGRRSYWRYFMWAKGDGGLIKLHPKISWRDSSPNSAELFLSSPILILLGLSFSSSKWARTLQTAGVILPVTTILANVCHDGYRHFVKDRQRSSTIKTSVGRVGWTVAAFEGGLIRMTSEMGRLIGLMERRELWYIGKRFDWFAGNPGAVYEERSNGLQRLGLVVVSSVLFVKYCYQ